MRFYKFKFHKMEIKLVIYTSCLNEVGLVFPFPIYKSREDDLTIITRDKKKIKYNIKHIFMNAWDLYFQIYSFNFVFQMS